MLTKEGTMKGDWFLPFDHTTLVLVVLPLTGKVLGVQQVAWLLIGLL